MGETVKAKVPWGAKAAMIKLGIQQEKSNSDIADEVEVKYPGSNRKNVLTEVSRYRQYLGRKVST